MGAYRREDGLLASSCHGHRRMIHDYLGVMLTGDAALRGLSTFSYHQRSPLLIFALDGRVLRNGFGSMNPGSEASQGDKDGV